MMLRPGLLLLLEVLAICSPGPAQTITPNSTGADSLPPVRVRWITDIRKKFNYESFDRSQSEHNAWKSQQGIAFLGPDEIALYQANKTEGPGGSAGAYNLQVEVLDAKDGHEIKNLHLPTSSEFAKLIPTHGGGFLLYVGDEVRLYSPKFELVASRKLPGNKDPASDDWQVDVSPSGAQIILVHQQSSRNAKGEETDSRADIEVLESETLKSIKAFSVPSLDQWSAADNAIISRNPEDENGVDYGIMDLNGKWRAIKTSAGSGDPGCPYRMEPLEHQLLAAHDCDDLVVVTTTGRERFSQPVRGDYVLVSVAGADRYLAEAMVEPRSSHAIITVYDLHRKTQVLWLSLEKKTIYFSISPVGTVAAVDGDRLKFFEPVLTEAPANPQQRWKVELEDQYGYESFDRDASPLWMRQQDVRFITPEEIAVYQVRHNDQQPSLGEGDPSGGGGNFSLHLEVLSARDGHEIKSLRLPTNAQFTKVIPTHDGKFLVRTGDVVNLYSANFEQFASRPLTLQKIEGAEGWQIDVAPSGTQIVLAHQQRFAAKSVLAGEQLTTTKDHADVEVLDADTLQPTTKFTVKFLGDNWSTAEHSLVASSPDRADKAFGLLDFTGKWSELKSPWTNPMPACPVQMQALPQDRVAVTGCRLFGVLSTAGEQVLATTLEPLELPAATNGAGSFVAVEVDKLQVGKPLSASQPERIDVFDLRTKNKVLTVPLVSANPYFDISSQGELAVIEGDHVSLYSANKQDTTRNTAN
ncbi:MAG TPA: hypothetical protein VI636_01590 [Candidatus Angelobacter sp.]